jgi:radical SAM superfamily enzyme YgiQ (UPF0313 family)
MHGIRSNWKNTSLKRGWARTLQVTIVIPYPGTKLFEQAKKEGRLNTMNWDDYDMKIPVIKTPLHEEDVGPVAKKIYQLFFTLRYIVHRKLTIITLEDINFILRRVKKVLR